MMLCETTVHPMDGMFDFSLNQEQRTDLLRVDELSAMASLYAILFSHSSSIAMTLILQPSVSHFCWLYQFT
jgi:hypothetical protein